MKKINLTDFPAHLTFTGYYWLSNQQRPISLNNAEFDIQLIGYQPCIVEGRLYNEAEDISIHIHFMDGNYHIHQMSWKEMVATWEVVPKAYLAHDLPSVHKIKVKEVWIPQTDPNCANMSVLQPGFICFTGFEYHQ